MIEIDNIVGLSKEEIKDILVIAKNQPDFIEISIKSDLTQRELSHLAIRSAVLEGYYFKRILIEFIRRVSYFRMLLAMSQELPLERLKKIENYRDWLD